MAAIGGLRLLGFSPTNLQSSNDCRKPTTVKAPLSLLEDLIFSELESIIEIEISGNLCPKLKSLELFCMEKLTEVRFSNCEDFEKLNCLKISECKELKRLSVTANLKLEEINISACPQLEEVCHDCMSYLKRITIVDCNLKNVQGILVSRMLEELNISGCLTLHDLSLAQLDGLRKVKIEKCSYLTSVTGISNLPKLVELSIFWCRKLQLELHLVGLNFLKKIALHSSPVMITCFRLDGCKNLEIVSGTGIDFRKIQVFNVSACPKLRELPVICGASRLQTITVNGCVKLNCLEVMNCRILERLSGDFDLAVLSIKDCPILEGLPCLGNMTRLKKILILQCGNLRNITLPMTLKRLELNACGELKSLSAISALTEMVELNIRACPKLYELDVAHLSKLEKLVIANLEKVSGISNLTKLVELEISECRDIEFELCLSAMGCLENIAIIKCEKMQTMTLPPSLTKLTLEACIELKKVAGLSGLTELGELNIKDCPELQVDLHLSGLKALYMISVEYCNMQNMTLPVVLRDLKVQGCKRLQRITELEDLTELTELYIIECPELEEIPRLTRASHFERIKIVLCDKLRIITLPTTLIKLTVQRCRHLQRIAGMSDSREVVELFISDCPELEELPVICAANCLERVTIDGCGKFNSFVLNECHNLNKVSGNFDVQRLSICDCPELEELTICYCCLETVHIDSCDLLQDITLPSTVVKLSVKCCKKLQRVAETSNLTKLTDMVIAKCPQLEELPNLSEMSCLESIEINQCERLHEITLPVTLRALRVRFCGGLKRVTGTDYSTQIECIDINECPNLEELPNLARLKSISIDSCEKLENIAGIGEMKSLERMQLLFCSNAAMQGCIRKLKSLPSAFNLIGKAANGAISNLIPSLLPRAISCADQATLFRTLDNLKISVSAIIVCSLVEVSGSSPLPATETIDGMYKYERPGQWMITTVIKIQHHEAVRHLYSSMDQSDFRFDEEGIYNDSYPGRVKVERWCAWALRTDEDWRTLPALSTIIDKLHHK